MPRQPRPIVAEIPVHIIQRGNNRLKCFFVDADFELYRELLRDAALKADCEIHAYALMTNHVHLLVSSKHDHGPASMMKSLGERYVQYVNRRHARTGTLWGGRYRSCLVQSERYLMVCHRYIELNPVRAEMVTHPADYPWSSYRRNAHGEADPLVTPHYLYGRLGMDDLSRERAYRDLFSEVLPDSTLCAIRKATNGNFSLGNSEFADEMSTKLGRPVVPRQPGRPKKQ